MGHEGCIPFNDHTFAPCDVAYGPLHRMLVQDLPDRPPRHACRLGSVHGTRVAVPRIFRAGVRNRQQQC